MNILKNSSRIFRPSVTSIGGPRAIVGVLGKEKAALRLWRTPQLSVARGLHMSIPARAERPAAISISDSQISESLNEISELAAKRSVAESEAESSPAVDARRETHYKGLSPHEPFYKPYDLKKARRVDKRRKPPPNGRFGPSAKEAALHDPFLHFGIDPVKEALNPVILGAYTTPMGRIKGRSESKLSWRSQRRMGKAIRRARQMGMLPFMAKPHLLFFSVPRYMP